MTLKEYLTTYKLIKDSDIASFDFLSADRVTTMKSHIMFRYGLRTIDFDDDVTTTTVEDTFTSLVKTFMQVNSYRYSKLNDTITESYNYLQTHKTSESGTQTDRLSGSDVDTLSGKDSIQATGSDTIAATGSDTIAATGTDTTTFAKGTVTDTTTPQSLKTQHKDRTYDSDTLEVTYEDIQSGSTQRQTSSLDDVTDVDYGRTDTTTYGRTDTTTYGRTDETTFGKVDTMAYGKVDTLSFGKIITEEGEPIEQLLKERQVAEFNFIDLMCRELANYVAFQNWDIF